MNDGEELVEREKKKDDEFRRPNTFRLICTFLGRARANSNAIWPILLDALSVMTRIALASRPCSPII